MVVYTRDHQRLGTIEELAGGRMKVSPRIGRDYWLSTSGVLAVDRGAVLVDFSRRDLSRLKLDPPRGIAA
jgi:hypothetical protein